uniref:Uncharacterized protein n=1 Tax=Medicago truncatula TaxID=3880 RepID=A2Q5S1_MEDTR|nr:hypothetical protein MtrDRAFT_AC168204g1v2 [Medicago truncatula]
MPHTDGWSFECQMNACLLGSFFFMASYGQRCEVLGLGMFPFPSTQVYYQEAL